MARSLIQAHERVKSLDWERSYVDQRSVFETKYHIPSKANDPFRHILRDFLAMENEKDDRMYSSLIDVLARTDGVNKGAPEFTEILKPLLPLARDAEYFAIKQMAMLSDVIDNPELRQGYLAQELDEIRHAQSEAWLGRYYTKRYYDPAGFNVGTRCREWNPLMMAGRACFSNFIAQDPIVGCLSLQMVAETAYTNPLFVALTDVSARSGDDVAPTLFLSIQSDEGRHMANGYSTLAAVLQDDRNLEMLQADLDGMFWRVHRLFDLLLGLVYDYHRDRNVDARPYRSYWDQWVWHDWGGSYMAKFEKFGLRFPSSLERAKSDVTWLGHTGAMLAHVLWPLNFWRQAVVPESAFGWYEDHYPGWYSYFGPFWEDAAEMADPANHNLALAAFPEIPPLCRVCLLPCVLPRVDISEIYIEEYGGRRHAFCSVICRDSFQQEPFRYAEQVNFGERFNGWSLADVIVEMGLLREDGKTLIGQPHLGVERMWTIDDIKACDYEIRYVLR